MPSSSVIPLDALLNPIPGDLPTGEDPRSDPSPNSLFQLVRIERKKAVEAERIALMSGERAPIPTTEWKNLTRMAIEGLREKCKDIEFVVYLIEALVRIHGFPGLRDGCRLARQLCDRYWDSLYPNDPKNRVRLLANLNGTSDRPGMLIAPITRINLVDAKEVGAYSFDDYVTANKLESTKDLSYKEDMLRRGAPTLEQIKTAIVIRTGTADKPESYYPTYLADLEDARKEFEDLVKFLDERMGSQGMPSSQILGKIADCKAVLLNVLPDWIKNPPVATAAPVAGSPGPGQLASTTPAASGPQVPAVSADAIRTREDALRMLEKLADFFRRTEPHNFVSDAIDRAVRWAKTPLKELLPELISDMDQLQKVCSLTGIKLPEPPSES